MHLWNYFTILGSICATVTGGQSVPCRTPNGESATCVSLIACPILLEALNKDAVAQRFLEDSACAEGTLMVCCGESGNYTQDPNKQIGKPLKESNRDYVLRKNLLLSKTYCGLQHTDDYFYNETETSVDEFPWLVYLVIPHYQSRKEPHCVGALISNRYVLTSYRDCYLFTTREGSNNTVQMIFGQHHIYKDVSCIPTKYGIEDCTQAVLRGFAYKAYAAPSTSPVSTPSKFGVAIIRLSRRIDFSDFVRPICLPLDKDDMPKPGDVVLSSGWGPEQYLDGKSCRPKKRIRYTLMGNEQCENGTPVQTPACGVPFKNNTHYLSPGDRGGPLMYKNDINWVVTGIIANTASCDDRGCTVIAERLTPETVDWIFDAIVLLEAKAKADGIR